MGSVLIWANTYWTRPRQTRILSTTTTGCTSPLLRVLVVLLIMLDTLKRYLFDGARPIDRTMMIVELLVLLFVAYEAIVLFADRRREKRRLRDEEKCLEKFDPVVQEELKVFVLE